MTLIACFMAVAFGICAYIYFGYPILIWLVVKIRPRPVKKGPVRPFVSIIVPVYNEENVIGDKISNTLSLDYEAEKMEILIVSDGSNDNTETIVQQFENPMVRLLSLERQGKAYALNEAVKHAQGQILVFTDANAMLEQQSLIHLVENFYDPEVGGICGNQRYRTASKANATEKGENLYWEYDKWLKSMESLTGNIFAADGSLHAIRRKLYIPIKYPAQSDDIAISTRVVLQGYRLVYEPKAITYENPPVKGYKEFKRKVRVTNRSLRALLNLNGSLWTSGFYSVQLLSHKFFRHLLPFPLLVLLVSNTAILKQHPIFLILFCCQTFFYGFAVIGYKLRNSPFGRLKPLSIPYYFCLANAAAFLGAISVLWGLQVVKWEPRSGIEKIAITD